jgi:hypothetical protein
MIVDVEIHLNAIAMEIAGNPNDKHIRNPV